MNITINVPASPVFVYHLPHLFGLAQFKFKIESRGPNIKNMARECTEADRKTIEKFERELCREDKSAIMWIDDDTDVIFECVAGKFKKALYSYDGFMCASEDHIFGAAYIQLRGNVCKAYGHMPE